MFEIKYLEKYESGMGLQTFYFALYSLHSFACFWACEDGLWRHHPRYQIDRFLFQDLHSQKDNGVLKMITRAIIFPLSKYIPKNEKDVFSS